MKEPSKETVDLVYSRRSDWLSRYCLDLKVGDLRWRDLDNAIALAIDAHAEALRERLERHHDAHIVRLVDLVRYQRSELHQANLLTDEEYATLAMEIRHSRTRLEIYDELRERAEKAGRERDEWIKNRAALVEDVGLDHVKMRAENMHFFRDRDALRAENARLREALRPFEAVFKLVEKTPWRFDKNEVLEHCRRAAEVLKEEAK